MNFSPAAASPSERLPWLPDEPKSKRIGVVALMLSSALSIVLFAAVFAYSPWTRTIAEAEKSESRAFAPPKASNVRPHEGPGDTRSTVQLPASPQSVVAQVAIAPRAVEPPRSVEEIAPARHAAEGAGTVATPAAESLTVLGSKPLGFECRLAKTRAALSLCGNPLLAELDRDHALLLSQSLQHAPSPKRALLLGARQRMAGHLNACSADACRAGIYLAAMREINGIMAAKFPPASPPSSKPSFSCRHAAQPGEIAVCRDPNLAELDRHQALLYGQSWERADTGRRARLLRAQQQLASGRNQCATQLCIKGVYLATMRDVAEIMARQ